MVFGLRGSKNGATREEDERHRSGCYVGNPIHMVLAILLLISWLVCTIAFVELDIINSNNANVATLKEIQYVARSSFVLGGAGSVIFSLVHGSCNNICTKVLSLVTLVVVQVPAGAALNEYANGWSNCYQSDKNPCTWQYPAFTVAGVAYVIISTLMIIGMALERKSKGSVKDRV